MMAKPFDYQRHLAQARAMPIEFLAHSIVDAIKNAEQARIADDQESMADWFSKLGVYWFENTRRRVLALDARDCQQRMVN